MILHGNALDVLKRLPENSVHTVCTSPPYWSLRDYGVPATVWGGDRTHDHVWTTAGSREGYSAKKKWQHSMTNEPDSNGRGEPRGGKKRSRLRSDNPDGWTQIEQGQFCTCGAWRGCLGLEPTPELYVEHLVLIFDEVRRVLRRDGTAWLNLGDCYAAGGRGGYGGGKSTLEGTTAGQEQSRMARGSRHTSLYQEKGRLSVAGRRSSPPPGLKEKDLVGVPWMVAFALRARGWYLRSDIIWSKTNPMPESTKDRPTKSHEYLFLLAKSQQYFFDADAIREGVTGTAHTRGAGVHPKAVARIGRGSGIKTNASFSAAVRALVSSRNRRSVWTIPTAPFKGAHFATFPPRLVEPCILAGTSEHGCCSICGAPFRRIVKLGKARRDQQLACGGDTKGRYTGKATKAYADAGAQNPSAVKARILAGMRDRVTVGWRATCRHTLREVVPCTVLDPFAGTCTTGVVAHRNGRDFIGIELNPAFTAMRDTEVNHDARAVAATA